ncbi:head to tail connecting protein [phage 023Pt_psg01]|nr:head to tail connecting protein [phage 023Pt_psg01]
MATIDKPLPNVSETVIEVPKQEELVEAREEIIERKDQQGNIEVTMDEEGGAEIAFDPKAVSGEGGEDHFENLADFLGDEVLEPLGAKMVDHFNEYKESRGDWEDTYRNGLDLLGFKYERRTEPFRGASGVNHPVLAEAVTQFQAQAYKELLPADGPVRTQILGAVDVAKEEQSKRVKDFMNYQIMDQMKEYEPEFDQMLFYLPLSGSTFKKVYYDDLLGRAVSKFVPADDLIVPYSANSLEDAEAVIHVIKISENDLRKQQVAGFYRDLELGAPPVTENQLQDKKLELEGIAKDGQEDQYTLYEVHTNLDLEGYEDIGDDGEPTGIKLPYVVTVSQAGNKVLAIRRNYGEQDPLRKKVNYFVQFKFLPGTGFYGFGLIHMIGGLTRTATAALRQLLDAGTLANLPAGFKSRGIRVRDDAQPLQPGEFRDVDAPGGNIKDQFMTLPFKGPDQTLLQLMGVVVSAGQRFAAIADMQVGDMNQQAAVGTTVALLERGSRVMSAIHKRIYVGLKQEFKLLAEVFKTYLPPVYPYDVPGARREIKVQDFDDRIDILPVADPNIFSQTQRISIAQSQLQLAQSNPRMHNLYQAYRSMYDALGVKNVNAILPPPAPPQPMDPALENIMATSGKPFQAFPGQDHKAHIDAHLAFMSISMVQNNPAAMMSLQKNILEHISYMAQEQIQLEFVEEMQELQMIQQQLAPMMQNPQMQQQMMQNPQAIQMQQRIQQITSQIESRKAKLIAEMMIDYAKEEDKISSEVGGDPLLKLKSRELDIKAKNDQEQAMNREARLDLDTMRAMMNDQQHDEKLEQNEDLAGLRAGVSLAKQTMADQSKIHDFGRNFKKK